MQFFKILFWIGQDVGAAISDNYSVCSQDWARMEEQISGPIAVKNPNDPKSVDEKAPAIAQYIPNWATTIFKNCEK